MTQQNLEHCVTEMVRAMYGEEVPNLGPNQLSDIKRAFLGGAISVASGLSEAYSKAPSNSPEQDNAMMNHLNETVESCLTLLEEWTR